MLEGIMEINRELMKGSTVILVLTVLNRQEMYGYELIKEIERTSESVFHLKEGTLYPILHSLEADGLVESSWVGDKGTRQRKYYRITKQGKTALKEKQAEWKMFRSAVDKVIVGNQNIRGILA
jgi:PadR family transcriptional regulator, regulatory protein PadR